jgi:glutaredoxin
MDSIVILTAPRCSWCEKAKKLLDELKYQYVELDITEDPGLLKFLNGLGLRTVPQVFNRHVRIGGYAELAQMYGRLLDEPAE